MAHMIDLSNNRDNMAFVGETPWHGLGVSMPQGASLLEWRRQAGLEWEAKRATVLFKEADGTLHSGDSEVIYRSDTRKQLGVVTSRYKPVQPAQVVDFFKGLCEDNGFSMETLGGLDGGKRIWALARTGESFRLMGQDVVDSYVLLATSFDGTMATRAQFTSVRVVCQNTLSMAVNAKGGNFVSVTHSADFNAKFVKTDLGIYQDSFKQMEEQAGLLAEKALNKSQAYRFLIDVFAGEEAKIEDLSTRMVNNIEKVYQLFAGRGMGADYRAAKGTMWGLVNAVTETVDHHQGYKADARLRSAWFGQGDALKTKALQQALKLVA
jgi:phage/plasmid-like protein (TIGR03299 family)